jgi:tRNA(adenine34) deaminase
MALMHNPEFYMRAALRQAERASVEDETPVGAVIVFGGRIVGRGYNRREQCQDVTRHAEIEAIRQACRRLGSWRLDDCTLYVTLEPCVMCAGAIVQARIARVFYGAHDPKAGAAGSVTNIFELKINHQTEVIGGILHAECSQILKNYFRSRRQQDKSAGSRSQRKAAAIARLAEINAASQDR